VGGLNDPHLEAMMETDARHPQHGQEPPQRFRNQQFWVAAAVVGVLVLGWIAYLVLR
jgi:hypothetical protein